LPTFRKATKQLKATWKFLQAVSPIISITSILVASGFATYFLGLVSFENLELAVIIIHLLILTYFIISKFKRFDKKNKELFIIAQKQAFYVDSEDDLDNCYEYASYTWGRITNYWRIILFVWAALYTWFLIVKLVPAVNGNEIPSIIQTVAFNIINNIETILMILSLSYLVRSWRVNKELTMAPAYLIFMVALIGVVDTALKVTWGGSIFNYSMIFDLLSGVITGVFFAYFISVLNNRFIGFPNIFILILFLYCAFMTVYPILNLLVIDSDTLTKLIGSDDKLQADNLATLKNSIEVIILVGLGIALLGKIIIIQLFYWDNLSIRLFIYLMSVKALESKYQSNYKVLINKVESLPPESSDAHNIVT